MGTLTEVSSECWNCSATVSREVGSGAVLAHWPVKFTCTGCDVTWEDVSE